MLSYKVIESQEGSLFIVTSNKDNLYGLDFFTKDIEEQDFDNDFLQENIVELAIAKFSKNESVQIRRVVEACHKIFLDVIKGRFSDKIIYMSIDCNSAKCNLIEKLIYKNGNPDLVHLKVENIVGQTFYFIFNEQESSSIEVINAITDYFAKEYNIKLSFS